jgi:hypothetical protein
VYGATRSFRPSGFGRYVFAAFLLVWLAGWVVGEAVALYALGAILSKLAGFVPHRIPDWMAHPASSGAVAFILLFLGVWLSFWTIGGVAAMTHFVRSLWGEDAITVTPDGLELVRRGGPFRRRYAFERAAIRRIRLRPRSQILLLDVETTTHTLTTFGTPLERQEAADWLIRSLSLPDAAALVAAARPPSTWKVDDDGLVARLCKVTARGRAIRSAIVWLIAGLLASAWYAFSVDGRGTSLLWGALLFAGLAALSTWARREWIVRQGEVTFRRSFAAWASERTFRHARLEVTHDTDSDNDSWFRLIVSDGQGRATMHSQTTDAAEVVDLAHWTAARTGFPLALRL